MRLIDREYAKDAVKYIPWCDWKAVGECLDACPTIDPSSLRPKGEWIMKETIVKSPYAKNIYCSECLEETSYAFYFCPQCGADMRGEEKEYDRDL